MMSGRLNAMSIFFMSHVQRPNLTKKHSTIRIHSTSSLVPMTVVKGRGEELSETRELCTDTRCAVYQLKEEEYQTRHVDGCAGRYDMVADEHEVFRILKNGCIPLILPIDHSDKDRTVTVTESGPDIAYVAISHV
jgi:hypothetical protein